MADIKDRLVVLEKILDIYDGFMAQQDIACAKGCATCCTRNVTMTTLEGYKLMEYMISKGNDERLMEKIKAESMPGGSGDTLDRRAFCPHGNCN